MAWRWSATNEDKEIINRFKKEQTSSYEAKNTWSNHYFPFHIDVAIMEHNSRANE